MKKGVNFIEKHSLGVLSVPLSNINLWILAERKTFKYPSEKIPFIFLRGCLGMSKGPHQHSQ